MRRIMCGLVLWLCVTAPSNGQSLTSSPEWQMLKDSLTGIGMSLEGASQPLTDVSRYFEDERSRLTDERNALSEDRRLFELDKKSWQTQKDTSEERGRLYDYLKAETEELKGQLDKAYADGIKWSAICAGAGVIVGLLIGGVLF